MIADSIIRMPSNLPPEYTNLSNAQAITLALNRSRYSLITPAEIKLVEYYYEGYNEPQRKRSPPSSLPSSLPLSSSSSSSSSNKRLRVTLTLELPLNSNNNDRPPTPPPPRPSLSSTRPSSNTPRPSSTRPLQRSYHANELYGSGLYGWQLMQIPDTNNDTDNDTDDECNFDSLIREY